MDIIMDDIITIQALNFFDSFFVQFLDILSHEARDKDKLPIFKNLVKSLKDKKL